MEQARTDTRRKHELSDSIHAELEAYAVTARREDLECRLLRERGRRRLLGEGEVAVVRVERYEVLSKIGAGGNGKVYRGYDPQLDRCVAIKELTRFNDLAALREAQAAARIEHPNVINIYDLIEEDDHLHIVMELLEGPTLEAWLRNGPDEASAVRTLMDAGRGLAAIHAAGVVHRDFKPANVSFDGQGQVRVLDFGLASAVDAEVGQGGFRGTRDYAAPEQFHGVYDPRSDQFAFCLVLYEALWGQLPPTAPALRPPESGRDLFEVIRRGLARERSERWRDMNALLAALEQVLARRRRRKTALWGSAIAAGIAGISITLSLQLSEQSPGRELCRPLRPLQSPWTERAKTQLREHVDQLEVAHAGESFARLSSVFSGWSGQWSQAKGQLCDELNEDHDASTRESLAAQASCLIGQHDRVEALLGQLSDRDANALDAVLSSSHSIPAPDLCTSNSTAPWPHDMELARGVGQVREQLGELDNLRWLGELSEVEDRLEQATNQAEKLRYRPLLAELAARRAMLADVRGDAELADQLYREAISMAVATDHTQLVSQLYTERAELSLYERQGRVSLETLKEQVRAARDHRIGLQLGPHAARLQHLQGRLAEHEGELRLARDLYREAHELDPQLPEHLEAWARVVSNPEQSLRLSERALVCAVQRYGPHHEQTARRLYNLAGARMRLGLDASEQLARAEQIWSKTGVGSLRWRAKMKELHANNAMSRGQLELAQRHGTAMSEIFAEGAMRNHPDRAQADLLLARLTAMRADQEPEPARRTELRHEAVSRAHQALARSHGEGEVDARLFIINQHINLAELELVDSELQGFGKLRLSARQEAELLLRQVELFVRRGQTEQAKSTLAELKISALMHERLTYELLWCIIELREKGGLGEARKQSLREALDESKIGETELDTWLEQLGLDAELRAKLLRN